MDLNSLKYYCLSKRGTTEDFPFDDKTLVLKVGSKIFAITNINDPYFKVSLKCDPYLANDLRRDYLAIKPGYHLNKTHWNTIEIDGNLSDDKIYWLLDLSYDLVFKGLKKDEKNRIANLKKN